MIARLLWLVRMRLFTRPSAGSASRLHRRGRFRRWSARRAVAWLLGTYAISLFGLAIALEDAKPQWRDPEYAHHLQQLLEWKRKAPDRPLALVLGSSRVQMGISPAAMAFPDESDSPLVYNFGYRSANPLGVYLQLSRLLDAGIRPKYVLIGLSLPEVAVYSPAERQLSSWIPRLTVADLKRVSPYAESQFGLLASWCGARMNGWVVHREAIINDLVPEWQSPVQRADFCWERMDPYGFAQHPCTSVSQELREKLFSDSMRHHARSLAGDPTIDLSQKIHEHMMARLREEGIETAFFWMPESPRYRARYTSSGRDLLARYSRLLQEQLGAAVFAAPENLAEDDFADGYHLLPSAAGRYSRWLAETYLKQWLAHAPTK
jgi:hypothetical protein